MKSQLSVAIAAALVLLTMPSCRPLPSSAADRSTIQTTDSFFIEPPELALMVARGELPPVAERLPANAMILQPVEQVGAHGGIWSRGIVGSRDTTSLFRTIGYENLVRWDEQWSRVIPNVAQSFHVDKDSRNYTFHLRKGMRWSDGHPFTADDIEFWYQAVCSHPAFRDTVPAWLVGLSRVEKIDETTVVFRFSEPNGLLLQNLAAPWGLLPTALPKHYFRKFHADYNSAVSELVARSGASDWVELFRSKGVGIDQMWANPKLPTLNAWTLTAPYGLKPSAGRTDLMARRNPYYWKIDPDGNQLPYIDGVRFIIVPNAGELLQLALGGKLDMQESHVAYETVRTRLEEGARAGGYRFFKTLPAYANAAAIYFNLTVTDPRLRVIFNDPYFRAAMSYAIDRQQIVDQVYGGRGRPYQVAPSPLSPNFHEELANQHRAFSVSQANAYLDLAGFHRRGKSGIRLDKSGHALRFSVDVPAGPAEFRWLQVGRMVTEAWRVVGVDARLQIYQPEDFRLRTDGNLQEAAITHAPGGLDPILNPTLYLPVRPDESFAPAWAHWNRDPTHPLAEEPPLDVQLQFDLYCDLVASTDPLARQRLMRDILWISADRFFVLGTTLPTDGFGILSNRLRNVPPVMPASWTYPNPAPTNPAQYYLVPETS